MLGRLLRLRLDVEIAVEANASAVVHSQMHQARHVVKLKTHIGVEERFIALAAAPEDVALAAELNGCVDRSLDLCSSISKDVCGRRCARTVHEARMIEALCGTPQELLAGFLLLLFEVVYNDLQLLVGFAEAAVFRREIAVMEAVVVDGELLHDLECSVNLCDCACLRILLTPALISHGVPPAQCELEVLTHRLAVDDLIRVVVLECKVIFGVLALIGDLADIGEKFAHSMVPPFKLDH